MCGPPGHTAARKSLSEAGLLRSDLLLKVEGRDVVRVLGEHVAQHLAGFGQPTRLDEPTREGDPKIVRVRRRDAFAEELDRCVGVAELARRLRRDRVETRERREERDGL